MRPTATRIDSVASIRKSGTQRCVNRGANLDQDIRSKGKQSGNGDVVEIPSVKNVCDGEGRRFGACGSELCFGISGNRQVCNASQHYMVRVNQ